MVKRKESSNNNVRRAFLMLLFVSIVTAALSAGMVFFFKNIRAFVPELVGVVCLIGIVISYMFVREHPLKQKCREMIIVSVNYLIVVLMALIYNVGFLVDVLSLFLFSLVFIINNLQTKDVSSSLLYNANSVFSMTMSVTLGGLLYARNISADWGTLYVTFLAGMIFVILGFIIATIILFSVDKFQESAQK